MWYCLQSLYLSNHDSAPCWPFVPTILLFVSINLNCSVFHIELFIFMLYLYYDINQILFLSVTNIPLCTCVHMYASVCTHSNSFISCMFGLLPLFAHCKRHWCEHEYINICSSLFLILLCVPRGRITRSCDNCVFNIFRHCNIVCHRVIL